MDNNLDYRLNIIQASIDTNNQDNDNIKKTLTKYDSEFTDIKTIIKQMMVQNHHYSPDNMESPKAYNPDTVVPDNKEAPPL